MPRTERVSSWVDLKPVFRTLVTDAVNQMHNAVPVRKHSLAKFGTIAIDALSMEMSRRVVLAMIMVW